MVVPTNTLLNVFAETDEILHCHLLRAGMYKGGASS